MRLNTLVMLGSSIALAAACTDRAGESTALSSDLKRDLDAAASTEGLQLANAGSDYQRASFVSEIEQVRRAAPAPKAPRPRPIPRSSTGDSPEQERTPVEQDANAVVAPETPTPAPAEASPAADEPRLPTVAPRPVPASVEGAGPSPGDRGGRDAGPPPEIGQVIGVIMRGGRVGDDHCAPRRRPGGRGFPFPLPLQHAPTLRLIAEVTR
jgi:hypothetical protein